MEKYPYAAGYYPLMHPKKDWIRDLDQMQEMGIKVVRTAELFNTWDQIEPVPGEFNFTFLDDFFTEAGKRDIHILLGTGTASPPYWLHEKDPEMNILSSTGKPYPNNVTYSWACFHNPTYLDACEKYINVLVNRYKDRPNLYAYQIHNEIGLPFMSADGNGVEMYCYCRHSKEAFRHWVQDKYKTLDRLNHAWTWSATNTCHTSWQMVEPPYTKPVSWSSMTRYLDFRLFMMDSITGFVSWQNKLLKILDPAHPTSTNIFYMKGEDKMGVLTAIDQFAIGKEVDAIGYDLYPGSGNKLEARPEFASMFLDHGRSVAYQAERPFWLMELESGPINGWALGPHRNTSGADIRRYVLEAVAHDAKMTLYQGYRQWDFQPLNWGGLVDLDGNPTPITEAAAQMGDFLDKQGEYILSASAAKGEVAILTSRENAIIANGMGHESFLVEDLRAYYRLFWELGFQVDFITPDHLNKPLDYKLICAPFMLALDCLHCESIAGYVEGGGLFLGEPRLGYVNSSGWYNHSWPPFKLADVFGVKQINITANQTPGFSYKGESFKGYWHKELVKVKDEKEVVARFFDDAPGAIIHQYGKGKGIYFATHGVRAGMEYGDGFARRFMQDLLEEEGIKPALTIKYSNRENREIDGHLLCQDSKDMLIITSYKRQGREGFFVKGKKRIQVALQKEYKAVYSAYDNVPIDFLVQEGKTYIEYFLKEEEYPVWYLEG